MPTYVPGQQFAYRESAHGWDKPLQPVEIVRNEPPKSRQVRIRWLSGDWEGLEAWVPGARLVSLWDEADAFLQDERRFLAVVEASKGAEASVVHEAVSIVLEATSSKADLGWRTMEREMLRVDDLAEAALTLGIAQEDLLCLDVVYSAEETVAFFKDRPKAAEDLTRLQARKRSKQVVGAHGAPPRPTYYAQETTVQGSKLAGSHC